MQGGYYSASQGRDCILGTGFGAANIRHAAKPAGYIREVEYVIVIVVFAGGNENTVIITGYDIVAETATPIGR